MPITEPTVVEIAKVEVNDACRIELRQIRKRTDYSPEQARELSKDLVAAADEADALLAETIDDGRDRPRTYGGDHL